MLSPPRWSWECWAICLSLRPWLHSSVNSVSPKQANEGGLHKVRDGCWIISPQSNNMCNFGTLEGSGPSNLSSQTHFSQSSMTQLRFRHTGLLQHCLKSLTERWWPSAAQSCLLRTQEKRERKFSRYSGCIWLPFYWHIKSGSKPISQYKAVSNILIIQTKVQWGLALKRINCPLLNVCRIIVILRSQLALPPRL